MQLTTGLDSQFKFTALSWTLLIVATSLYCFLYDVVFHPEQTNLFDSLSWSLKAWCIWLLLIPFIFKAVENKRNNTGHFKQYFLPLLKLGCWLCSIALLIQLFFGWLKGDQLAASIYYYIPANLEIFVFISLFAVFIKRNQGHSIDQTRQNKQIKCIDSHNQPVMISNKQIDRLAACGNYIEVHCGEQQYMIRATMKAMEAQLTEAGFVRIHRSHIINPNTIAQVKHQANGQSFVFTRCGTKLPLSRSYKHNINTELVQII